MAQGAASLNDLENVYDQCGTASEQQHLLRTGVVPENLGATTLADQEGPLGEKQYWCGGRDAYQPLYASLSAVQDAWHVKTHDSSGNMKYTRAPAGDLRPL